MNSEEEENESPTVGGMIRVFLLQNFGLLSGFGLMLLLALYAGKIEI